MDDYISRQAAKNHLKKRLYETALNSITEHPYYEELADNRVNVWLNELPSAERRGRWIGYNTDKEEWKRTDGSPVFMSCSECYGTVLNNGSAHWNYCPNCGARMEESEWTGTKKP